MATLCCLIQWSPKDSTSMSSCRRPTGRYRRRPLKVNSTHARPVRKTPHALSPPLPSSLRLVLLHFNSEYSLKVQSQATERERRENSNQLSLSQARRVWGWLCRIQLSDASSWLVASTPDVDIKCGLLSPLELVQRLSRYGHKEKWSHSDSWTCFRANTFFDDPSTGWFIMAYRPLGHTRRVAVEHHHSS